MSSLLLRRAEVDGVPADVRVDGSAVTGIGPPGTQRGADEEIDCAGGALLPGLHDHHVHLMAMAAALDSVDASRDVDAAVAVAHARTPPGRWLRVVGFHERESGPLDRGRLDALAPGRPVRVQHRSGSMWVLNSAALEEVGAATSGEPGIERDPSGRPTGRLFRLDDWLGARLPERPRPDLSRIGRRLASFGVTGVTDCTPVISRADQQPLADAVRDGTLPLRVAVTGGPELSEPAPPEPLLAGPVKIVVADHELPALGHLVEWFRRAHRARRPVAVHCVTRSALVLALAAWQETGSWPGDRIEHGSVIPAECSATIAGLGIAVVTQPAFLAARGDDYLRDVEVEDRGDLYRCASLLAAGVEVGGSTDAPFGPEDPWLAVRAATDRRSPLGVRVGLDRDLDPVSALDLFLAPLSRPGGPSRRVAVGAPADLCLLDVPLGPGLADPASRHVALTLVGGSVTFSR
jgi:predicted amidohydrolase YtcJ